MPSYAGLNATTDEGKRIIRNILTLRKQLDAEVPARTFQETLLLATWNIREFDSGKYGARVPESFYYIAEIIDRFDLVAVQEIREDLKALDKLMEILGEYWKVIFTDVTQGKRGNGERMGFLYDSRKISFGGLASQLVLPPVESKDEKTGETIYVPVSQLARTPLMAGFVSSWTRFVLATVHILYGEAKAEDPERVKEIQHLAQFLKGRTEDENAWARNLILLGDFNIFAPEDATMKALLDAEFTIPPELQKLPSNAPQTKFYDQIAFRVRPGRLDSTGKAGVFNFFKSVFRLSDDDEATYSGDMGKKYQAEKDPKKKRTYYQQWRTFQMSDHLPMWVELQIDYSDEFLKGKLKPAEPAVEPGKRKPR
jgi:exonuclease III